jgi:hypothetical protein
MLEQLQNYDARNAENIIPVCLVWYEMIWYDMIGMEWIEVNMLFLLLLNPCTCMYLLTGSKCRYISIFALSWLPNGFYVRCALSFFQKVRLTSYGGYKQVVVFIYYCFFNTVVYIIYTTDGFWRLQDRIDYIINGSILTTMFIWAFWDMTFLRIK